MALIAPFVLPKGVNPDLQGISRALLVVAHPDDIDFGSAGTVAVLTSRGIDVSYCLVSSGESGGDNDGLTRQKRAVMRESEQRDAAKVVGVDNIHFLRQTDGEIEPTVSLREKITRVIRTEKPDLVLTQSPQRRYDRIFASHPDHLAVGEACISACYPDCQNPNAFEHLIEEGLAPHKVKAVWLMADASPDTFVDITDVLEKKFEALFSHVSQIEDRKAAREIVEEWSAEMARAGGLGAEKYAEAYKFVQIMYA